MLVFRFSNMNFEDTLTRYREKIVYRYCHIRNLAEYISSEGSLIYTKRSLNAVYILDPTDPYCASGRYGFAPCETHLDQSWPRLRRHRIVRHINAYSSAGIARLSQSIAHLRIK